MKQAWLIILMYAAILTAIVYHSPTNAQPTKPKMNTVKATKVIVYDNGCFDAKKGNKTIIRCI